MLVADTAVTEMPEAHEIADIAIEAAGVARRLGDTSRAWRCLPFPPLGILPANVRRG